MGNALLYRGTAHSAQWVYQTTVSIKYGEIFGVGVDMVIVKLCSFAGYRLCTRRRCCVYGSVWMSCNKILQNVFGWRWTTTARERKKIVFGPIEWRVAEHPAKWTLPYPVKLFGI